MLSISGDRRPGNNNDHITVPSVPSCGLWLQDVYLNGRNLVPLLMSFLRLPFYLTKSMLFRPNFLFLKVALTSGLREVVDENEIESDHRHKKRQGTEVAPLPLFIKF